MLRIYLKHCCIVMIHVTNAFADGGGVDDSGKLTPSNFWHIRMKKNTISPKWYIWCGLESFQTATCRSPYYSIGNLKENENKVNDKDTRINLL